MNTAFAAERGLSRVMQEALRWDGESIHGAIISMVYYKQLLDKVAAWDGGACGNKWTAFNLNP